MASAINDNFPLHGNPTTQSVRDNFTIAKNEITALQASLANVLLNMPYLPLSGATMNGPLKLYADPVDPTEAATKAYVDAVLVALSALAERVAALEPASQRTRGR
jgi:NADPH-dependent curcumin reductase CurA